MERRTLALAAAAFVTGLVAAALLLHDGAPLSAGAPAPMLVRLENTGAREASALFEVNEVEGDWRSRSVLPLAAGGTQELRVDRALTGDVFAKVTVTIGQRRADQGTLVDPSDCPAGQRMVVTFRVDTDTPSPTFGATDRGCAR